MSKHAPHGSPSLHRSIAFTRAALAVTLVLNGAAAHGNIVRAQERNGVEGRLDGPGGSAAEREATNEVKPVQSFVDAQGRSCRVYMRTVTIEGEAKTAIATVCREPNGRWVFSR